jgi:predicted permease
VPHRRIARAERWYRLFIAMLPRELREEHGNDMAEAFRDQSHGEYALGGVHRVRRYWLRAYVLLLVCGFRERMARLRRRVTRGSMVRAWLRSKADQVIQDTRCAVRTVRRQTGFASVVVLTLALGIGGATAIYTLAHSVLLSKSPFHDPGRLVTVWGTRPDWRGQDTRGRWWNRDRLTYREYQRWRQGTSLFEDVAMFKTDELVAKRAGNEGEERLLVGIATSSLMPTLGIQPSLGRWFLPEEEGTGASPLVVLGHSYWERRFDSDPSVIGSSMILRDDEDLEGIRFTVIGVAPEGFSLRRTNDWSVPVELSLWRPADPPEKDIWLPLGWDGVRSWPDCEGLGRLRPGVSVAQARAEIEPLIRGEAPPTKRGAVVQSYYGLLASGPRKQMLVIALPAALLLLIAFTNLAGLLLAEIGRRRHELATRMALGAGRMRIVAQLLSESAVLGFLGSALGALLAIAGVRLLVGMAPSDSPLRSAEAFWPGLQFAVLIGIGGTVLFALAAAMFTRLSFQDLNRRTVSGNSAGPAWGSQRRLVTIQVAVTAIMLVQAGLLSRTLLNLSRVDLGYRQQDLAVLRFSLPSAYKQEEWVTLFDEILARVEAVPGVVDVSLINALPLTERGGTEEAPVELASGAPDPPRVAQCRTVSPGYHEMMGIPLLQGRLLSPTDQAGNVRAAVVSEFMAQAVWPGRSPLGDSFRHQGRWYQVVGVVGDVHHSGPLQGYVSTFYTPYRQVPRNQSFLVAHVPTGPRKALPAIDRAVRSIRVPVMTHLASTMDELVSGKLTDQRYHAVLSLGFGIVALILAATGVLGVAARAVTSRRHEIGVKKALGAGEGRLAWGIVGAGAGRALLGVVIGLLLALACVRVVSGFLFGVGAADPATYFLGGFLLLLVSAAASYIPARRIAAIDPVEAMKAE